MAPTALICTPGFEELLRAELGLPPASVASTWPGWLEVQTNLLRTVAQEPAFARQVLPDVCTVHAPSNATLAAAAIEVLLPVIGADDHSLVLTCDALPLDAPLRSRARFVETALRDRLKSKHRKLWRRLFDAANEHPPRGADINPSIGHLSLVLLDEERLAVSYAPASSNRASTGTLGGERDRVSPKLHWSHYPISPWALGRVELPQDKAPPSRAYLKLREAWAWMGRAPQRDEEVVDLGGSPGGWAYVCLQQGARVTGVDRAPYDGSLAHHRDFRGVIGDAFTYRPDQPVEWLVCDVICAPARTVELVQHWLEAGLCRHVVATLKFKSDSGYDAIAVLGTWLSARNGLRTRIKHLGHNRHEVTVMVESAIERPL